MKNMVDIVDFHSHILPGADHGSASVETTLLQLGYAKSHGVSRIFATPHFYPHVHSLEVFLKRRADSYGILLESYDGLPEVKLGAEVLICNGIENLPGLEKLFVGGTTLLLELPITEFQREYCESVSNLIKNGVEMVLAHRERYPKQNVERLLAEGIKLQVNASSLLGTFRKKYLIDWLSQGYVVAIGSDIHGSDSVAYADFKKVVSKLEKSLDKIRSFTDNVWVNSK